MYNKIPMIFVIYEVQTSFQMKRDSYKDSVYFDEKIHYSDPFGFFKTILCKIFWI